MRRAALLVLLCLAHAGLAAAEASARPAKPEGALESRFGSQTGDLDAILEHRGLRVLVPYSRTLFFYDGGSENGAVASAIRELERRLNEKFPGERPITVSAFPTTRDQLLPSLIRGIGVIAAGNITITEARMQEVDFTLPTLRNISEIIVTGPGAPELLSLGDLAGKEVHVRPVTSYHESLVALNQRFAREGKPQMTLTPLPDEIEDEDKLDMVNAGLIRIAVVDDWIANIWAEYLPDLKLHPELAVRTGGEVGWAVRKDSPRLKALLDEFITSGLKQGLDRAILKDVAALVRRMQNATGESEMKKFHATIALFRKYGAQYDFDYLMLAAQGYQESHLDQSTRSSGGAIGILQVMPAIGKEMEVGDITQADANVHAGSKHMAQMMERYFKDAEFDQKNRTLFAFASYNAGADKIAKARTAAAQAGLDPDVWFNQVEHVVARQIGQEPVQYVRNIFKYYVAYQLVQQAAEARGEATEEIRGDGAQ